MSRRTTKDDEDAWTRAQSGLIGFVRSSYEENVPEVSHVVPLELPDGMGAYGDALPPDLILVHIPGAKLHFTSEHGQWMATVSGAPRAWYRFWGEDGPLHSDFREVSSDPSIVPNIRFVDIVDVEVFPNQPPQL